jgi:LysB family phage lysis regulatory protein
MGIRLYLLLGVLIAFLGVGGVALWYRGEAISAMATAAQAKADLNTAVEANKQAVAAIGALTKQAEADNKLTASLVEQTRAISDGLAANNQKLVDLEKSNAAVRDYLDAAVPADLDQLFHGPGGDGGAEDGQVSGAGGAARQVPRSR